MSSFVKSSKKRLLTVKPGSYFKLDINERKMIDDETTGLVVSSYDSKTTGACVYNVVLVNGELLLITESESEV